MPPKDIPPISDEEREGAAAITAEDIKKNPAFARRFLSILTQAMLAAKQKVPR